jgi:hypothetical protein
MPDLRPGNRGIGVSVAVGHHKQRGIEAVARTVIRTLKAWDSATRKQVEIQPGAFLESYRILRNRNAGATPSVDVYLMEFESAGQRYCCPLAQFQPRTLAVEQFVVEEEPARDSIAV